MSAMFSLAQTQFRFYADGTESGSTALANQNTNHTVSVSAGNAQLLLRVMIDETGGVAGGATDDYQLQVSQNGGAFADVTTSSADVKAFASSNLTDAGNTTSRLTGGTGSFSGTGCISEDGLVDNYAVPSSGYGELLYTIELVAADLADNDTLDFRVLRNGSTFTYSVTPGITVEKATAHATSGALTGQLGSVSGSAAHIARHATSGVLAGQGATVAGSAARTRLHATSGVLVGQIGSVAGSAARTRQHATSGVLSASGAAIAGSASRAAAPVSHATTGALTGQIGSLSGAASRIGWDEVPPGNATWTPTGSTPCSWSSIGSSAASWTQVPSTPVTWNDT